MRLLMTGDTAGGVFTFVSDLAEGLCRRNVDVTLVTFGPTPPAKKVDFQWFHHASRLEWQAEPWDELSAAGKWLNKLIARVQPDLLHFNTLCHGDLNAGIPLMTTVHSCVASWWSVVKGGMPPAPWDQYRKVIQTSLRCASKIVVPSLALLNDLQKVWNVDFSKAIVIPNGRDPELYRPAAKEPFILSAGRFWDEAKNSQALDSAAIKSKWPIYLAGEEANSASACKTLGFLPPATLASWYARASIYVSPAKYEPFGLSVLEAAMSGCALLLSDIPSFRENWTDAALFFNPDSSKKALDDALAKLISNPDLRRRLQAKALARSACFAEPNMIANYLSAYEALVAVACVS